MRALGLVAALALGLLPPTPSAAQVTGFPSPAGLTVTGRLGYDIEFDEFVAGAALRADVGRLPLELQIAGDWTFLDIITERQVAIDLLYKFGRGGLSIGGGPVFRNSVYITDDEPGPRETRTGYSLLLSMGGVPQDRSRLVTGLEFRWIFIEEFRPRTLMAQVGVVLFRW